MFFWFALRIQATHIPTSTKRGNCFTLLLELRTAKPLGTSKPGTVVLTDSQRLMAKRTFRKRCKDKDLDFEEWLDSAVESDQLMMDIDSDDEYHAGGNGINVFSRTVFNDCTFFSILIRIDKIFHIDQNKLLGSGSLTFE